MDYPVRLFAVDCVVYNQIDSPTDIKALQQDLSKLEIWEDTWKMDFNPFKCFSMNIIRKINPFITDYSLKGTTLVTTEHSTYLVVTIRKNLKWGYHVNKITSKANKTFGLLRRNIKTE